jgi:outer membrane protein, multidrug efflux system
MFEGLRARAEVITARCCGPLSLRLFFVVFSGLALVQMLSGCMFSSERPDLALDVPPAYRAGRGVTAPPALDWWRGFRSAELTKLIEEAQTKNLDIAVAIALILQADAQSKLAGVPLLPLATANVSSIHSRPSQTTGPGGTGGGGPSENQL